MSILFVSSDMCCETRELVQWIRVLAVLPKDPGSIARTHGGSQITLTPVPRDPILSGLLEQQAHRWCLDIRVGRTSMYTN